MAVNSGGGAIIMFNGGLNNLWAISGTVTGGFSAPVDVASGAGSNHYQRIGTSAVALNNAGQAPVTRSPSPPEPPASAPAADHWAAWAA
jgi:hypothetical protein